MKQNQQVKPVINIEAGTVAFEVKGRDTLVLHMDRLHPDIIRRAALVGMAQVRIVDAAAVGRADEEGNLIPEEERIEMKHGNMAALIAHYETGTAEWSRMGQGGGGRSITVEAIARAKGITYDEADDMVDRHAEAVHGGDRKKALAHLRAAKAVMEAMAAIRAERTPAPKVDADAALAELK